MNWIKLLIIIIVVVYLLVGLFLFLFQERLLFLPEPLNEDHVYVFETDFEELSLEMEDGAVLNALLFTPANAKGIIVYFHGNAGNLVRWGEVVEPFAQMGYEVLIVDYRGYGKSTGTRSKTAMLSDAEMVYAYATETWPQEKIVVYGRSLGSAFATHVAYKFQPGKLILETPFASVADVARELTWMYPTGRILRYNFNNLQKAPSIQCPTVVLHGDKDLVVPVNSGRKLAKRIPGARYVEIAGGGHNDLAAFKAYWDVMEDELR